MGRMDDHDSLKGEGDVNDKPAVRVERAGMVGLTTCKFDVVTGEHLSTTRPYEARTDVTSMIGLTPGYVVEMAVSCPIFGKCSSCPEKESETTCDSP